MPDRPRPRTALPSWLPLAAGGAALAVLLALTGGYFVYQDQQDRAARAAHADCVAAWKQVNLCMALVRVEEDKKYDELRAAGVSVAEAVKQADAYAKATPASTDEAIYTSRASLIAYTWGDRWASLGLPTPGP